MTGVYNNIDLQNLQRICAFFDILHRDAYNKSVRDNYRGGYEFRPINAAWAKISESVDGHDDAFYVPSTQRIHWYLERHR